MWLLRRAVRGAQTRRVSIYPESAARNRIDTSTPHPARVYDYLLGGKDNFAADREQAKAILQVMPKAQIAAQANRAFLRRAVRYLTAERGLWQFLDIGTGIPTVPNVHEVAQSIAPESRIVYVDNDPIVLSHARALMTGDPAGETAYVEADLGEPGLILDQARLTLDFTRPVALLLVAVLHFVRHDAHAIVARLVDALPSGSCLVISHGTTDLLRPDIRAKLDPARFHSYPRTREQVEEFFNGLDLVDPGLVPVAEWRPEDDLESRPTSHEVPVWAGVAIKP